eukprot:TRINITY_DN1277_c0_g1_i2.p1 TRINITY_DN1277_c0_g1~~TRINITY_DN1277_c0_g1_i2.p1  ORF type:complete len:1610 (+),score=529.40 TRINITY_DN1277_c0_g1_i2:771-5600(+)
MVNTKTMQTTFLLGLDCGGIGSIAVHPQREFIAVAEKGFIPNIYIYEYPSLKLVRVLRKGTERAYSHVNFSPSGSLLCSVGAAPDYMLTVWNWKEELILLRSKAFSQDVFNVTFSPSNEGQLTTSGTGHIKFWKMARTFTGLKLQGDIGKFGAVELSDIVGYQELPDGKVLSGTESGGLLLWDGNLIKCELAGPGGKPAHAAGIDVVFKHGNEIVTGSPDGYLRFWDFEQIDQAESSIESPIVELAPLDEIQPAEGVAISQVARSDKTWLVADRNGALWQLELPSYHPEQLKSFHAGGITAVDTSPVAHFVATTGVDGTVRVYDYFGKEALLCEKFPNPGTALTWVPKTVDPNATSIIAGFENGVVRVLNVTKKELVLTSVFKPHTDTITAMAYSPDGTILCTVSADKNVFFLNVQKNYEPIGFVQGPGVLTSLCWHPSGKHLLVTTDDGLVVEYSSPDASVGVDTTKSFEIELNHREYLFRGQGKRDEDEEEDFDDDEYNYVPNGLFSVQYCADGETFYLTVEGSDAGYIYQCSFDEELPLSAIESHNAPCRKIRFSRSGKYLVSGGDDGTIRLRQTSDVNHYWQTSAHDNQVGEVTDVALSYDDAFLFSVASDGTFFVHRVSENTATALLDADKVPSSLPTVAPVSKVSDLKDSDEYSIEQAKLKREHDKKVAAAELKKQTVRAALEEVRTYFKRLKERNDSAPPPERLPDDAFEMYPELRVALEKENVDKVHQAQLELNWFCEKFRIGLQKWKNKYLDALEVEYIKVFGLKEDFNVTTFRLPRIPESLSRELSNMHKLIEQEEAAAEEEAAGEEDEEQVQDGAGTDGADGNGKSVRIAGNRSAKKERRTGAKSAASSAKGRKSPGVNTSINKAEAQRERRQARKEEWEQFIATKPTDSFAYAEDVEAIWEAENNMGDYKLKSDPDYIVPENQRVDDVKKRRQMVLLEESRHEMMLAFNCRLLDLRSLKKEIIKTIQEDNARIKEINAQLGITDVVFEPTMQPEEQPELRYHVTDSDVSAYAKDKARREREARDAKSGGGGGGLGGFGGFASGGGGGGDQSGKGADGASEDGDSADEADSRPGSPSGGGTGGGQPTSNILRNRDVPLSDLEEQERAALFSRLVNEKATLQQRITETIASFDQAIYDLRIEKFRLAADMKQTDVKLLVLQKELHLLEVFGKQDSALMKKQSGKLAEKADIVSKIVSCQERLQNKQEELAELSKQDEVLREQYEAIVGEQNPYRDALTKIFKKKIKRRKNKPRDLEDENSESDDDNFDDFDESDFEDEDEDDEEEMCPPGCSPDVYNQVIDLREQRLDQQEQLAEFQKSIEALVKENEGFVKKEKLIDTSLKQIEKEIQAFQSEKQRRMNELDVVVSLKMEQIETVDENGKPVLPLEGEPMDNITSLVFTRGGLARLQNRIKELVQEIRNEKKRVKHLKQELFNKQKNQKAKIDKIQALTARVLDVQLLKFGQEVDLENLERLSVNRLGEEMKLQLQKEDQEREKNMAQWDARIKMAKVELANVTSTNTQLLNSLLTLSQQQQQLEGKLAQTGAGMNADDDITPQRMKETKETLMNVLRVQAQEIENLKAQVTMLRHKGGNIFTPVTDN